jgi:iron(III) transport system permease protein
VALPWALPGTVLAIALASTFSVNRPLEGRFVLVGTFAILPLAYFIRNVPLVTRAALSSFRQLDPALEEAAASLGASPATSLRRVVLPLVLPGLAAGALLAFVTALGEFVASILLYTQPHAPHQHGDALAAARLRLRRRVGLRRAADDPGRDRLRLRLPRVAETP